MRKFLLTIALIITTAATASAESLFTLGAAQTYHPAPKSLYGGVQARTVGDLISIILDETVTVNDTITYGSSRKSSTSGSFPSVINAVAGKSLINDSISTFGGANDVETDANTNRKLVFGDTVAVQVVQQMPNGNLVVQGKKVLVNSNERMDLIVTGVVDPRWIDGKGQVYSKYVANLQFAASGRGSVSRSNNEGIINRFIRYLF